jgi:1,3-beta-glucan synthase component
MLSCLDCSHRIYPPEVCNGATLHCVQRVMAWPGGVRFHYGHPDLWNRLWVMTRGGVSKSTRWPPLLLKIVYVPTSPAESAQAVQSLQETPNPLRHDNVPYLSVHVTIGPPAAAITVQSMAMQRLKSSGMIRQPRFG